MPGIVQSGVSDLCLSEQCFPLVVVRAWIDRLAVGLSKHVIALVPHVAGFLPFLGLDLLVLHQQCEQLVR